MNAAKRKKIKDVAIIIQKAGTDLSKVLEEEEGVYDNVPDSLKETKIPEKMRESIQILEEVIDCLNDSVDALNDI